MEAIIIYFSPTGNTRFVANTILKEFQKNEILTQLVDVTKNEILFNEKNPEKFLSESIPKHDILMIGSPVYAHHVQYHVMDLIKKLPRPNKEKWGKIAIPFVTYGGIDSGIALEEAEKYLKKSGRTVIGGLKFSASHNMTRVFMDVEFNKGKPNDEILPIIEELVETIKQIDLKSPATSKSKLLQYQSRKAALIAKIILNEKKFHEKRYPNPVISLDKCVHCGKCVSACPVVHWKSESEKIIGNPDNNCIHCYNCIHVCNSDAITLTGDLEKGREFMQNMIEEKGNKESPANFFYQ